MKEITATLVLFGNGRLGFGMIVRICCIVGKLH